MASRLTITNLAHDLVAKKSYVTFVWADEPGKRLGLEVPYGTAIENIEAEASKAIEAFKVELTQSQRALPDTP